MRYLFSILFLLPFLISNSLSAEGFYKWKDARGNIQYGDEPPKKSRAKKMKMPPLTVLKDYANQWNSPELSPPLKIEKAIITPTAVAKKALPIHYSKLAFIAPKQGQLVKADNGDISAMLSIKPKLKLKNGHRLRFTLDGKTKIIGISRFVNFQGLNNGLHTLSVDVIGKAGEEIQRGNTMNFTVAR